MDLDETWQVGLRPEKLSLARFQRNRAMGFGESAKEMGRRGVVFLSRVRRTTSATFLGSISTKLSTNRWWLATHGFIFFIYPEKFPLGGSNFPKTRLFRVL